MTPSRGIEPGPHWWEASALTTAPSLHPNKPWITSNIKAKIKASQRTYTKGDVQEFARLRSETSEMISKAKAKYYESKVQHKHESNPASWYKSVYELSAANEAPCQLTSTSDLSAFAGRLQTSFTRPRYEIDHTGHPDYDEVQHLLKDTPPSIPSVGQVKTTLKDLNTRKATGVDDIPAWCLKGFYEEFAPVVHDIKVSSITQCKYPSAYKHALVSPIPKVRPT